MSVFGTGFRCENDFFASIPIEQEDYGNPLIRGATFGQITDREAK
jgi:hypothetical protein